MEPIRADPDAVALVAEDEVLMRMEAADLLADAGFAVLEAHTAMAALAHLERTPSISLLFTDIEMPGPIDGIGLAYEVVKRWPNVSIVVCSGRFRLAPGDLPRQARFIAKPFSPDLMMKAVAGLMH